MSYIKEEKGINLKYVNPDKIPKGSKFFGLGKECKYIRKTPPEYKYIKSDNTLDNSSKGEKVK